MAYRMNRPGYGSANYYESDKEVVRRGPYDSYASEYRNEEYANPGYSRHNGGGAAEFVETETMTYESNPNHYGHRHHHNGGAAEFVERREDIVYENGYPSRRAY